MSKIGAQPGTVQARGAKGNPAGSLVTVLLATFLFAGGSYVVTKGLMKPVYSSRGTYKMPRLAVEDPYAGLRMSPSEIIAMATGDEVLDEAIRLMKAANWAEPALIRSSKTITVSATPDSTSIEVTSLSDSASDSARWVKAWHTALGSVLTKDVTEMVSAKLRIAREKSKALKAGMDEASEVMSAKGGALSYAASVRAAVRSDYADEYASTLALSRELERAAYVTDGLCAMRVTVNPQQPKRPVSPRLSLNVLCGGLVGFLMSGAIIFVRSVWRLED